MLPQLLLPVYWFSPTQSLLLLLSTIYPLPSFILLIVSPSFLSSVSLALKIVFLFFPYSLILNTLTFIFFYQYLIFIWRLLCCGLLNPIISCNISKTFTLKTLSFLHQIFPIYPSFLFFLFLFLCFSFYYNSHFLNSSPLLNLSSSLLLSLQCQSKFITLLYHCLILLGEHSTFINCLLIFPFIPLLNLFINSLFL